MCIRDSSHRAHASVAGVTKFISAKGGSNVVGYMMEKEIAFLGNAVENPVRDVYKRQLPRKITMAAKPRVHRYSNLKEATAPSAAGL